MTCARLPAVLLAAACLILAVPSAASAAQRFASPGGSGLECSEANPCALPQAVSGAIGFDEVIVEPGEYVLGETVTVSAPLNVHGRDGAPRPRISGEAGLSTTVAVNPLVPGTATLRHLEITNAFTGGHALSARLSTLDDLVIGSEASNEGTAVNLGNGAVLRNSVVDAPENGAFGVAVNDAPIGANVINSTIVTAGNAIRVTADGSNVNLTVRNTILRGSSDIHVDEMVSSTANVVVANSNYRSSATSGNGEITTPLGVTNQTAADPLFVNAAGGDFHQAAGSPTIDAGAVDPLAGLFDFDGEPRLAGLFPDIGADEMVPRMPIVFTGDAGDVSAGNATVSGSVNPNTKATNWRFEYGTDLGYGSSTATQALPASSEASAVSAQLSGLTPGTIVHYRVVAENSDGSAAGLDRVLVVPPDLTTPPPVGGAPQIIGLSLPGNPVVGETTTLSVQARDEDDAVNGIQVDFDEEQGVIMRSACVVTRDREDPDSGPFAADRTRTFNVPYEFRTPGVHEVRITLFSGGCIGTPRTATEVVTVLAMPPSSLRRKRDAATAQPAQTASCAGADDTPTGTNAKRMGRATLCLVNAERRAAGLGRVRWGRRLARSARAHNRDMHARAYLAHEGPGGPNLALRLRRARYRWYGGENLGVGSGVYGTPRGMVGGWMNSPTHRANVLQRRFKGLGVSVRATKPIAPNTPGATYVANFGARRR